MSRIARTFSALNKQGHKALIPYITAGDPNLFACLALMRALVAGGADIIELGVPFSDPMADGPVIQRASERALAQGVRLKDVLELVRQYRFDDQNTPIVLMGYLNPIERMGYAAFADGAHAAGVDGVLVVDLPPEEGTELWKALAAKGIDAIFLLAPTSSEARIDATLKLASGYVYYVSLKGVTGAANIDIAEVAASVGRIKARTQLPIGVGFGIRDGATAAAIASFADAVVIGSRLVQVVENGPAGEIAAELELITTEFRSAMDARNDRDAAAGLVEAAVGAVE